MTTTVAVRDILTIVVLMWVFVVFFGSGWRAMDLLRTRLRERYRRQHRVTLNLTLPCSCCGVVAVPATVTLAPGERVEGVLVCSLCGAIGSFNADAEVGS